MTRALIRRFRYSKPQLSKEIGVCFPERIYHCSRCRKAIPSFEKRYIGDCIGTEVGQRHLQMKMYKLLGFLAHPVLFDDEEIDVIAIILFKNYVMVFPIEVQISPNVDIENTYEKFQKLKFSEKY